MNDLNGPEAESKNRGPGTERPCTNEDSRTETLKSLSQAVSSPVAEAAVSSSGAKGSEAARPPGRRSHTGGMWAKPEGNAQTGFPLECLHILSSLYSRVVKHLK